MQKVILDTNVIIAALIGKSSPYTILHDFVFENKLKLCISDEILQEYYSVLNREKFSRYTDFKINSALVINRIEEIAAKYHPSEKIDILKDKSDNKFLELAFASTADYIVTGNSNDFTINKFENTLIVSPTDFLNLIANK